MANFYDDNEDLKFYVEKFIDWDRLVDLVELHYKATDAPQDVDEAVAMYRDVLQLAGEFVANEVDPRARAMDAGHVEVVDGKVVQTKEFEEIFDQLKEMGIYGLTVPRELGGMNLPLFIYFLVAEIMGRGDAGVTTHLAFHAGIAASLVEYSIREGSATFDDEGRIQSTRWDEYLAQILSGEAWGSMDLTEPDAGSDLAALRCRARQDDNGVWRLTGNKIFITSGHGKFHLVLAKTSDEVSLEALSMFVVPSEIERDGEIIKNLEVDRVEDKIGHHSSATASVQLDDSEGDLIGKAGEGFQHMLMLMNNARIGVGFESLGVGEAAYRMARAYAAERPAMGKTIDRHEIIADYLDEMEVTLLGIRALAVECAISEETHTRITDFDIAGVAPVAGKDYSKVAQRAKRRARLLTPLLKYAAAEAAVHLCRTNMQIHGGNGYSSEFGAERLLRDSLVLPIYEGTSQIQALMALKDHLGAAIKRPQQFVQRLARAKYNAVRVRDNLERRYWGMRSLALSAQQHILLQIAKEKLSTARTETLPKFLNSFLKNWDPKRDFSFGLVHAEHLIKILADVEIAHLLLEQAKRFPERREIAERWLERAEPRVRYNWDLITTTGDRIVELVRRADAEVEAEENAVAAPH